jgi:hypothetical protein
MRKEARAYRKLMRYYKKEARRSGLELGEYMQRLNLAQATPRGMASVPLITIQRPAPLQRVVLQDRGIEMPTPTPMPIVQKSVELPPITKSVEFPRSPVIARTIGKSVEPPKDLSSSTGSQPVKLSGKTITPPAGMSPTQPRQDMAQTTTTTTTTGMPFVRPKKSDPRFTRSYPIEQKKDKKAVPQILSKSDSGSPGHQDPERILTSLKQLSPDLDKLIAANQKIYQPDAAYEHDRVATWSSLLNKALTGVGFDQEDTLQRLMILKHNIDHYQIPPYLGKTSNTEDWETICARTLQGHAANLLGKL